MYFGETFDIVLEKLIGYLFNHKLINAAESGQKFMTREKEHHSCRELRVIYYLTEEKKSVFPHINSNSK